MESYNDYMACFELNRAVVDGVKQFRDFAKKYQLIDDTNEWAVSIREC